MGYCGTPTWRSKNVVRIYRTVINKANNTVYFVPDSIAFTKMDQKEFTKFFDDAMMKLAEAIGYDPLSEWQI